MLFALFKSYYRKSTTYYIITITVLTCVKIKICIETNICLAEKVLFGYLYTTCLISNHIMLNCERYIKTPFVCISKFHYTKSYFILSKQ